MKRQHGPLPPVHCDDGFPTPGPSRNGTDSLPPPRESNRAFVCELGVAVNPTRTVCSVSPHFTSDVSIEDWDALFCAVKTRLRRAALGQPAATDDKHALETIGRLRAGVLDCVAALDQLHASLSHELVRYGQVEREFQALKAEVIESRKRLVDSEALRDRRTGP